MCAAPKSFEHALIIRVVAAVVYIVSCGCFWSVKFSGLFFFVIRFEKKKKKKKKTEQ